MMRFSKKPRRVKINLNDRKKPVDLEEQQKRDKALEEFKERMKKDVEPSE